MAPQKTAPLTLLRSFGKNFAKSNQRPKFFHNWKENLITNKTITMFLLTP